VPLTGGTIAWLAAEGHRVIIVVACDSECGLTSIGPTAAGAAGVRGDPRRGQAVNLGYADSGHEQVLFEDPPGGTRFARADVEEAEGKLAGCLWLLVGHPRVGGEVERVTAAVLLITRAFPGNRRAGRVRVAASRRLHVGPFSPHLVSPLMDQAHLGDRPDLADQPRPLGLGPGGPWRPLAPWEGHLAAAGKTWAWLIEARHCALMRQPGPSVSSTGEDQAPETATNRVVDGAWQPVDRISAVAPDEPKCH
jgi:hypothetical protein